MSLVPYVVEQTSRGERSYDIFSRSAERPHHLFVRRGQRHVTASLVVAQMLYLEGAGSRQGHQFYINSPGGSITDGMAIYDTMQYIKCDVSTICVGMAASMGAFLLAAGAKGKRFRAAQRRDHDPSAARRRLQGQATDIKIQVDRMLVHQANKLNRSWPSDYTGKPIETIRRTPSATTS
jgi:ATP-dependent Clp protease protease subunit